ncbi:MAG TPA: hydrogenase maturation nickel metallochaperone HypA [Xanthobacteraceae bacterium]|nr:hydrogenase maturation nickel metallochaperone HypA [Xanthobacteraceae bacterium]
MHEVSICGNLLALLDREAKRHGVERIVRVRLEIGRLSCLEPEALRFAFDAMRPGTIAEAAVLQIDQPPIRAACEDCGGTALLGARLDRCPSCGGGRLRFETGDEMRLIEMEAA